MRTEGFTEANPCRLQERFLCSFQEGRELGRLVEHVAAELPDPEVAHVLPCQGMFCKLIDRQRPGGDHEWPSRV